MSTLSKTLIIPNEVTDTLVSVPTRSHSEDICLFSESPHYIVRVCGIHVQSRGKHALLDSRSLEAEMWMNSNELFVKIQVN